MKSREEWLNCEYWHLILVGLRTLGRELEQESLSEKVKTHASSGEQTRRLMAKIYDFIAEPEKSPKPAVPQNGSAQQKAGSK